MPLLNMLSPERVLCRAHCASKKRVLETLSDLIAPTVPELKADALFHLLINRERLGSTGLGQGIAIPHCRIPHLDQALAAVMTLDHPVAFDAMDAKPVDLVFALLVPEAATQSHLQILAALAEQLQKPQYVSRLRDATTASDLYTIALAPFTDA
jgi:nitrogen PTS system EIIA component